MDKEQIKLPKDWKIEKLGSLCSIVYGKGLLTKNLKESGFPVFGANGIIGFNDKFLYKESKVLISCRGAYSGKINFSPPQCYVTNNSLVLDIKNENELDKNYLFYSLGAASKTKLVTGTAQPQVTINNAVELEIPLPPLQTQQLIVSKIEELFSELDIGIENLKTAQQQLKTYRQAVLKWAFEGKLTNENVKERELPKGWSLVNPADVASREKYSIGIGPFGSNLKVSDYQGSGVPLVFVKNITRNDFSLAPRFVTKDKFLALKAHSIKPLDIVITKMGDPPGDCAIYPENAPEAIITADCLKFRINEEVALRKFIFYALQTQTVKKQLGLITMGVAQKKISVERFKNIHLPLTSIEEQFRVITEIESRLSVADKMEESISQSLQQAEALRQSILKKALEGKLI